MHCSVEKAQGLSLSPDWVSEGALSHTSTTHCWFYTVCEMEIFEYSDSGGGAVIG